MNKYRVKDRAHVVTYSLLESKSTINSVKNPKLLSFSVLQYQYLFGLVS